MINKFGRAGMALLAFLVAQALFMIGRRPTIWLICERPDEARDNGYHLFRHICRSRLDIPVYYVIAKECADREKVEVLGPALEWGSWRHYKYWFLAEYLISAHAGACAPENHLCHRLRRYSANTCQRRVNLQHGVIGINLPDFIANHDPGPDLLMTTASREREFLIDSVGYRPSQTALTGLCRHDALYHGLPPKRQILLMPTWRRWLASLINNGNATDAKERFVASSWFHAFDSFLRSQKLRTLLDENEHELVFFPHYGAQPFLNAFTSEHPRITIADRTRFDVQHLLMESSILVSDFSSVTFDFALMGRPVVYLLPDEEQFFKEHFERGYFDLRTDGFGPVALNAADAVEAVSQAIHTSSPSQELYRQRAQSFFAFRDDRNCERNLEAILALRASHAGGDGVRA